MKSKDNEYTLTDLIRQVFEECDLTDQVNEMDVIKTYKSVVGDLISKLTLDIKLKDKILYLKLSSAALKNELLYKKQICWFVLIVNSIVMQ